MICGSTCSKSRLAKAAGVEVAVQQRNQKWHAAVARSTFASENVQNTSGSDQFLKFQCPKMACGCGAKHICKSKCTKHRSAGPILELPIQKMAGRCGTKHICKSKCLKTGGSEQFWKLRCPKMPGGCGAERVCKSKRTKHAMVGPLFEVQMSKN